MTTLTPNQVAESCGVSRDTVASWIRSGELPAIDVRASRSKLGKARYRIDRAELEAFLKRRRVQTPPTSQTRQRKAPAGVIQFFK